MTGSDLCCLCRAVSFVPENSSVLEKICFSHGGNFGNSSVFSSTSLVSLEAFVIEKKSHPMLYYKHPFFSVVPQNSTRPCDKNCSSLRRSPNAAMNYGPQWSSTGRQRVRGSRWFCTHSSMGLLICFQGGKARWKSADLQGFCIYITENDFTLLLIAYSN